MRTTIGSATLLFGLLSLLPCRGEEPFIQTLQVRGHTRGVELETHAGQGLDRAGLERDLRRLWATGQFEDIHIESTESPEGLQLVFTLAERPRLYLRRVEFEPARERRPLGLKPGAPVDAVWARQVAAALRRQLVEEGHRDAAVAAELIPVGFQAADLRLRVEPGPAYRVEEVRFSGSPRMKPGELQGTLLATRIRRLLPGVPGLWGGWRLHPAFSQQGVEADLARLQSFYLSRGYFDARVSLAGVDFAEDKATITYAVEAGPRYRVSGVEVAGASPTEELAPDVEGNYPAQALCRSLLEAQESSERQGALNFAARVEVEPSQPASPAESLPSGDHWVNLTSAAEAGPPYTLGRIEFRGHHAVSDLTLRRALPLEEGEWFDRAALRRGLARLNETGLFEPLTEGDVVAGLDPEKRLVHLTLWLREKPRGRWTLAGPLGPLSLAGPLQFSIGSRLPAWGRGPLELSTYTATFSLLVFSQPALRALSLAPRRSWLPLVGLERSYLPGQRWQSGFLVAPQLGWQGMLTSYGLTQARHRLLGALATDPGAGDGLAVPVRWRAAKAERGSAEPRPLGHLLCEASKPRWAWLRAAGLLALDVLLAVRPL